MSNHKKSSIIIEEVSSVREILEMQIERLRIVARERTMSYEEVKVLDLLNKNLLLEMGKATNSISVESRRLEEIKELPNESLIEIAQTIDKDLISRSLELVDDDKPKAN